MSEYLFDDPHIEVTVDGDVIPPAGESAPLPAGWAERDLRNDHEWTNGPVDPRGQIRMQLARLANNTKFSIRDIPPPPEDGSWGRASRNRDS